MLWGGDQASDFWSLRALLASLLTAAASGLLEPLPRRRRLPRQAAGRALRARAAGSLGPARRAVAADAGPRPLPAGGLDLRRRGARPLPRGRAAARAAGPLHPRRRRDRRAQRPADHAPALPGRSRRPRGLGDRRLPTVLGPALWVAPVLDEGAARAATYLPRGEWICWWTGERLEGGRWIEAEAPLEPDPDLGALGLDRRHLPGGRGRARGSARRTPGGRSRRRCGASRGSAAPRRGSPTAPRSAGATASGRSALSARWRLREPAEARRRGSASSCDRRAARPPRAPSRRRPAAARSGGLARPRSAASAAAWPSAACSAAAARVLSLLQVGVDGPLEPQPGPGLLLALARRRRSGRTAARGGRCEVDGEHVEPPVGGPVRRLRGQPRVEVGRAARPSRGRRRRPAACSSSACLRTRGSITSQSCISPRMSWRSRARRRAVSAGRPKQNPVTSST